MNKDYSIDKKYVEEKGGSVYAGGKSMEIMKESEKDLVGIGESGSLCLDKEEISQNTAIFGERNYRNSTFFINLLLQRIYGDDKVVLMSSNKEDRYELLRRIPEDKINETSLVKLFNFNNNSFSFNMNNKMEIVQRGFCRALSEGEKPTIEELKLFLSDSEFRESFIEDNMNSNSTIHMRKVRGMDESEFDKLHERILESEKKIRTCIKDNKICIFDFSSSHREFENLIAHTVVEEINEDIKLEREDESYNIFISECSRYQKIYPEICSAFEDLEEASFYFFCQSPSQLDEEVEESISSSVDNIFFFNIPKEKEDSIISQQVEKKFDLEEISNYELIKLNHNETLHLVPPFPPKRGVDEISSLTL